MSAPDAQAVRESAVIISICAGFVVLGTTWATPENILSFSAWAVGPVSAASTPADLGWAPAAGTTADLRARQVGFRQVEFYTIMGICAGLLVLGATWATWQRRGFLRAGPLKICRGGIYLRGKLYCASGFGRKAASESAEPSLAVQGEYHPMPSQDKPTSAGDPEAQGWQEVETNLLKTHSKFLRLRRAVLLFLYLAYVGTSIGLPLRNASTASCSRGFFWETHMVFLALFMGTKLVELLFYVNDPTIVGDLSFTTMLITFLPSSLGYMDGYTDATAVVIANSCPDQFSRNLATVMGITYVVGVVIGQWCIAGVWSIGRSDACFMKVLHMDALAKCVSLPEEAKPVWNAIHLVRTFGEDLPQAVLQTLFLIYVKENYFMLISVCIGVLSSLKALYDAFTRVLQAPVAWRLLCHSDPSHGSNKVVWDMPVEEGMRLAQLATRVRIQTKGKPEESVTSLAETYPIEDLRNGHPIGWSQGGLAEADVSLFWEASSPDKLKQLRHRIWRDRQDRSVTLDKLIYWANDNGQGLHFRDDCTKWIYDGPPTALELLVDAAA